MHNAHNTILKVMTVLISLLSFTLAGNKANVTRNVTVVAPTFTSITLESNATTLNIGEKATLTLVGTYPDKSTEVLTKNIEYIISPSQSVALNASTLTALKDGIVTLQAKVGTLLSNTLTLNIAWVVDGHVLPHEPDSIVNNATLAGVDSNNNGVRDDVERKIYEKYPVKLHRVLLIDGAKFYQKTLMEPTEQAQEIVKSSIKKGNCKLYLMDIDDEINSRNWRNNREYIKNLSINTKERVRKYLDYNLALSGEAYGSSPSDWNREACSPEVIKALEEKGL